MIENQFKYGQELEQKLRSIDKEGEVDIIWAETKRHFLPTSTSVCGIKSYSSGGKRTDWWCDRVKASVQRKKQAWKEYNRNKSDGTWEVYVRRRNETKLTVRTAKGKSWKEFGQNVQKDYKENARSFRKKFNVIKDKISKTMRNIKDISDKFVSNDADILERWRQHYSQVFEETIRVGEEEDAERHLEHLEHYGIVWEEEVKAAVERLKTGKAPGRDGIAPEFIKYGGKSMIGIFQALFQKVYEEKRIPKD